MLMRRRKAPEMKDILTVANGVFSHMNYTFKAGITKAQLDLLFMGNWRKRNPSQLVDLIWGADDLEDVIDDDGNYIPLTNAQLDTLAAALLSMYKPKWDKLGDVYDIEYDPIHNYLDQWEDESDGTEELDKTLNHTGSESVDTDRTDGITRTDNLTTLETLNLADSNTRTDNLSKVTDRDYTDTGSNSGSEGIYGFNSNASVPSNTSSGSESSSGTVDETVTNTGTVSDQGTQTGTRQTQNTGTRGTQEVEGIEVAKSDTSADVTDQDVSTHRERSGKHTGNIGNLTSQKMIAEEINLWRWSYMQEILNDAKEMLTLPTYLNS